MARVKTNMVVDGLTGRVGEGFMFEGRSGLIYRRAPRYSRPTSPAQLAAAQRFKLASDAWKELSVAQVQAWRKYAEAIIHRSRLTGQTYSGVAFNTFIALATKVLQVNPEAEIPLAPPTGDFLGDRVSVQVTGTPEGVVFSANRPNAPGVVTELMLQALPNPRRKPTRHYRSEGFVAFTPEAPVALIPLPSGAYATAIRFVQSATGRTVDMTTLGVVEVP